MNTLEYQEYDLKAWITYLANRFAHDMKAGKSLYAADYLNAGPTPEEFLASAEKAMRLLPARVLPTYVDPNLPQDLLRFLETDGLTNHLEAALIDDGCTLFVLDCIPGKWMPIADHLGAFYAPHRTPALVQYERAPHAVTIEMLPAVTVFTYGTLMRNESRHHLLKDAEFIGEDSLENSRLFDAVDYPALLHGAGEVFGELYLVPAVNFWQLDTVEGHPHLFERQWVKLKSGARAWVYFGNKDFERQCKEISGGDWRAAKNEGRN